MRMVGLERFNCSRTVDSLGVRWWLKVEVVGHAQGVACCPADEHGRMSVVGVMGTGIAGREMLRRMRRGQTYHVG